MIFTFVFSDLFSAPPFLNLDSFDTIRFIVDPMIAVVDFRQLKQFDILNCLTDFSDPFLDRLRPAENFFYPGYYKAFDEVYETLKKGLDDIPLMVAPEASGFDNFVTAPLNFKRFGTLRLRSVRRELDCKRIISNIVLPLHLLIL